MIVLSQKSCQNANEAAGQVIDNILLSSVENTSLDNITAVMIGFKGFESIYQTPTSKLIQTIDKVTEIKLAWD